jgi:hypothetical protein
MMMTATHINISATVYNYYNAEINITEWLVVLVEELCDDSAMLHDAL